jgi:hypothetical protein
MLPLRELALAGTDLARARAATIRVKLLKISAAVMRNIRRIRILFASHHPLREIFLTASRALASSRPAPSASPTCGRFGWRGEFSAAAFPEGAEKYPSPDISLVLLNQRFCVPVRHGCQAE